MFEDDENVFISRPVGGIGTEQQPAVTLFGMGMNAMGANPEVKDHLIPEADRPPEPKVLTAADQNAAEALPEDLLNRPIPDGWAEEEGENGQKTYRNTVTGEQQLERPTMPGNAVPSDYARTGRLEVGWPVSSVWENGRWYDGGFIADHNPDGSYRIWWPGWGNFSESVAADEIELAPFFKAPMLQSPKKSDAGGPPKVPELSPEEIILKFDKDGEKLWQQLLKINPELEDESAKYMVQSDDAEDDDESPLPEGWLAEKDDESGEVLFYINENTGERQEERPVDEANGEWDVEHLEEAIKLQMAAKGMSTLSMVDVVDAGTDKLMPDEEKARDEELARLDVAPWVEGDCCFAVWTDGQYYPGIVRGQNDDGSFRIYWPRWANESHMVAAGNMMRPAPVMPSQEPNNQPQSDPTAAYACGSEVFGKWLDRRFHAGTIVANNADGTYRVLWKRWNTETDSVVAGELVLQMPCPSCEAICQATGNFCLSCGHSFNGQTNASTHGDNWQATMAQTGWGQRDGYSNQKLQAYEQRMKHRKKGWTPLEAPPEQDINKLGKSVYGHMTSATQIIPKNNEVHLW